jgi:hypothetical protein
MEAALSYLTLFIALTASGVIFVWLRGRPGWSSEVRVFASSAVVPLALCVVTFIYSKTASSSAGAGASLWGYLGALFVVWPTMFAIYLVADFLLGRSE